MSDHALDLLDKQQTLIRSLSEDNARLRANEVRLEADVTLWKAKALELALGAPAAPTRETSTPERFVIPKPVKVRSIQCPCGTIFEAPIRSRKNLCQACLVKVAEHARAHHRGNGHDYTQESS